MPFTIDSADFDGTNDYMLRGADLTGSADSKSGIFSAWVRLDGGDAVVLYLIHSTGSGCAFRRTAANRFAVEAKNAAATTILLIQSNSTFITGTTWRHVLASWDLAATTAHLYITDVSDVLAGATITNDTIDYTKADWGVGATVGGATKMNGCMAELYFAPGQYLDFSVAANRRNFIDGAGRAVFLGTAGSLPTGTAPLIYQHLDDAEAVANFATNRGTGGNFTITGALDTGSDNPIVAPGGFPFSHQNQMQHMLVR